MIVDTSNRSSHEAIPGGRVAMRTLVALALSFGPCLAASAQSPSFKGKAINMLISYAPGGGTDLVGRMIASTIVKYLPGNPSIAVQNMPGAEGTEGGNYFVRQAPDGLTVAMSAATQADPLYFRRSQSRFKPYEWAVIGGVERGGTALVITKDALPRLHDKTAQPVIMGSLGSVPRAGMQAAAWGRQFLGWNLKWVVGYPGTAELIAALERGEVEMTSTAIAGQLQRLLSSGKVAIVSQSGALENGRFVPQPNFDGAPMLADLMKGKLTDPIAAQSFDYWSDINSMDEWMALPPQTPSPIVDAYRAAFYKTTHDPDFLAAISKVGVGLKFREHDDVERLLRALADVSPAAIGYIGDMLRTQGLKVN